MNFSDEEYVRLYTTDTITWDTLPWQAIALLPLALRKFDRSGVFDFGKHGAERALAVKTRLPVEVVSVALEAILAEEIWTVEGTRIYWPTYIEAQNCRRSDRLRKRLERSRRVSDDPSDDDQPCPDSLPSLDSCHVSDANRDTSHDSDSNRDKCRTLSHPVTPGRGRGEAGRGEAEARDLISGISDAQDLNSALAPPPPSTARVRSEIRTTNAAPPPGQGQPPAPTSQHSEPPTPKPPSAVILGPVATRRQRATDDLRDCPIGELAQRCRANPNDAAYAGVGDRPELQRVNTAWSEAVGLKPRPLGTYTDKNWTLLALLDAFAAYPEQDLLRACEQAGRDDWCSGRKGTDRDPKKKRDIGCFSLTVIRRLLDAAEEHIPKRVNPRVQAFLDEERKAGRV